MKIHSLLQPKLIAALILFSCRVFSQNQNNQPQNNLVSIPPPPNASAIFKFVETPVSMYTGIPDIKIPIYDIKLKSLTLPISLNYHSGGFKVDEQASDVGLGWVLSAGGVITSTIFGKPDFGQNGYLNLLAANSYPYDRELNPQTSYDTHADTLITNADYKTLMSLTGNPKISYNNGGVSIFTTTPYDTQADLWFYSVFNNTGKFAYTRDGVAHTIPFNNYKIIRLANTTGSGYQIVDEKGNIYIFDLQEFIATSVLTNTSLSQFSSPEADIQNYSYYLTKIYTPLGDTVHISYNANHYTYTNQPVHTRYRTIPNQPCQDIQGNVDVVSNTDVHGQQISQITTNRGHVINFTYQNAGRLDMPGSYALKQIDIIENGITKSFVLTQEYFNQANYNNNPDAVRLKLKQVQAVGVGNYNLTYNHEYDNFPSRFDLNQDHWGYYNGYGGGIFPIDSLNGFYQGGNRNPSVNYSTYGILSQLSYPTGGFTNFNYEANQFRDTSSTTSTVGGGAALYYDPQQTNQSTTFVIDANTNPNSILIKYNTTNTNASPQFAVTLSGPGNYNRTFNGQNNNPGGDYISLGTGTYTISLYENGEYDDGYFQIFFSEQVPGQGIVRNSNGAGIRIKSISDFSIPGSSIPTLTTNYTYTNRNTSNSSGHLYSKPSYFYIYDKSSFAVANAGCGINQTDCLYYTQTSQTNMPLSSLNFGSIIYDEVQESRVDNNGVIAGLTDNYYQIASDFKPYPAVYPFTPPTSYDFYRGNLLKSEIYKNVSGSLQLQKRITNVYNYNYTTPDFNQNYSEQGGDYIPPTQPNETHFLNLNVQVLRPEYSVIQFGCDQKLPALFNIESYKVISNWQYLAQTTEELYENNSSIPITTTTTYNYDNPAHIQLTKSIITNSDGKQYANLFTYPQDYAPGTTFIDNLVTAHNLAKPIETVRYQNFNGSINLLDGNITEYIPGGNGSVSNLYKLANSQPVSLGSFKFSNAYTGNIPNYTALLGYAPDSRYTLRTSFTYNNDLVNPREVIPIGGPTTTYLWGYGNLYQIAGIRNATYQQVLNILGQATIDQLNTNPGSDANVRATLAPLRAALPQAQVTIYTYAPLVGITSTTDPKGMTTYYEYDSFQRLMNIKDKDGNVVKHLDYHYANQ